MKDKHGREIPLTSEGEIEQAKWEERKAKIIDELRGDFKPSPELYDDSILTPAESAKAQQELYSELMALRAQYEEAEKQAHIRAVWAAVEMERIETAVLRLVLEGK